MPLNRKPPLMTVIPSQSERDATDDTTEGLCLCVALQVCTVSERLYEYARVVVKCHSECLCVSVKEGLIFQAQMSILP